MTTTRTQADPAVELEKLEKAATKAREEAEEIGARLRTQQAQHREVEAALAALARSDPRQFNGLGKGTDAAKKLRQAAALIHEGTADYIGSTGRQTQIAYSCDGLDGQDVWSDPIVTEARKLADRLAEVQPPRSVSLVPLTSEEPPRVRSQSGGFIGANVSLNNAAEDQPERVEPV